MRGFHSRLVAVLLILAGNAYSSSAVVSSFSVPLEGDVEENMDVYTPLVALDSRGNVVVAIGEMEFADSGAKMTVVRVRKYSSDGMLLWTRSLGGNWPPAFDCRRETGRVVGDRAMRLTVGDGDFVDVLCAPSLATHTLDLAGTIVRMSKPEKGGRQPRGGPSVKKLYRDSDQEGNRLEGSLVTLRKLDASGCVLWEKTLPGMAREVTTGLVVDQDGGAILHGILAPSLHYGTHYVIKKVRSDGELLWVASNDPEYPAVEDGRLVSPDPMDNWPNPQDGISEDALRVPSVTYRNVDVNRVEVDQVVRLRRSEMAKRESSDSVAYCSPTSRAFLYCAGYNRVGDGWDRLWLYDIVAQRETLIVDSGLVYGPSWSPNGERIAYQGLDRKVRIYDMASGVCITVTASGYAKYIRWSHDGQSLWLSDANTGIGGAQQVLIDRGGGRRGGLPPPVVVEEAGAVYVALGGRRQLITACGKEARLEGDTLYYSSTGKGSHDGYFGSGMESSFSGLHGTRFLVSSAGRSFDYGFYHYSPDGALVLHEKPIRTLTSEVLISEEFETYLVSVVSQRWSRAS
ncbi:MAG: WD40 repeat domain-containing protein [Candidatus Coatesbacteria bacterium]